MTQSGNLHAFEVSSRTGVVWEEAKELVVTSGPCFSLTAHPDVIDQGGQLTSEMQVKVSISCLQMLPRLFS